SALSSSNLNQYAKRTGVVEIPAINVNDDKDKNAQELKSVALREAKMNETFEHLIGDYKRRLTQEVKADLALIVNRVIDIKLKDLKDDLLKTLSTNVTQT